MADRAGGVAVAVVAAAMWHVATHELLAFAAVGIALSLIDDLVVDLAYVWFVARRRTRPAALLPPATPGWMAIIVPAWDEADVIGAMLAALTARLDHPAYRVFVGVYPNDLATRTAVEGVGDPRIAIVECSCVGPTTKADCLNHLWRAIVAHETAGIM